MHTHSSDYRTSYRMPVRRIKNWLISSCSLSLLLCNTFSPSYKVVNKADHQHGQLQPSSPSRQRREEFRELGGTHVKTNHPVPEFLEFSHRKRRASRHFEMKIPKWCTKISQLKIKGAPLWNEIYNVKQLSSTVLLAKVDADESYRKFRKQKIIIVIEMSTTE